MKSEATSITISSDDHDITPVHGPMSKSKKTTGQPIDRLSFVISAQVGLSRH